MESCPSRTSTHTRWCCPCTPRSADLLLVGPVWGDPPAVLGFVLGQVLLNRLCSWEAKTICGTGTGGIPLMWPSLELPCASRESSCSRSSITQQNQLESGCSWIIFPLFSFITPKSSHLSLLSRLWHSPCSMGWSWSSSLVFHPL